MPPASWVINDLMRHMGRRYFVGLLTAAALHGAGHQQPMAFEVMVDLAERDIKVGRVRTDFHMSSVFDGAATQPMQTETGTMQVAGKRLLPSSIVPPLNRPMPRPCWSGPMTFRKDVLQHLGIKPGDKI